MAFCRGCPAVASGREGQFLRGGSRVLERNSGESGMNELMDIIMHRRAIRRFDPVQISESDLQTILEAGLYAPSAEGTTKCDLCGFPE